MKGIWETVSCIGGVFFIPTVTIVKFYREDFFYRQTKVRSSKIKYFFLQQNIVKVTVVQDISL